MALFDHYIAVDWSAHSGPKTGRDSIWIAEIAAHADAPVARNPATRQAAMEHLSARIGAALAAGERVLLGFDFAFGYPEGAAAALSGVAHWSALWQLLAAEIEDAADNGSNRFVAAGRINARLAPGMPRFWGHPWQQHYEALTPRRPAGNHATIPERRRVEARQRNAQPVWKLSGIGAVGSQALLGIPRLEALRRTAGFGGRIAVWPFETGFANDLSAPVVLAEIFPSLLPIDVAPGEVRDRQQVLAVAGLLAAADAAGELGSLLSAPPDLAEPDRAAVLREEGWIVGVGHPALLSRFHAAPAGASA